MKRSIWTVALVSVLTVGAFLSTRGADARSCGAILASYGTPAVPARSNQNDPDESCGGRATYGLQYQCVEYVRRFYHLVKGIETREGMMGMRWNGNANTYFKTADEKGLDAFPNGGAVPPLPDDILAFQGGPYGHVAIITAVYPDHIEFVEQNFSPTGTGSLAYNSQTHHVENRPAPGALFVVEGWLRPRLVSPPAPKGPVETVSQHPQ